jgi:hypothetical protein
LRKKISISLAFSAAILLLASPLVLFNLLQPVQAQTVPLNFRTTEPADGADGCTRNTATITLDAKGTPSSHPQTVDITNGTFQITSNHDGQVLYSGKIYGGRYINNCGGGEVGLLAQAIEVTNNTSSCVSKGDDIRIVTSYSTSDTNTINVYTSNDYQFATFQGAIGCSTQRGGDTTTHTTQQSSSSSMTGTTQDGEGDGIPNANDNCPNLPHTRC